MAPQKKASTVKAKKQPKSEQKPQQKSIAQTEASKAASFPIVAVCASAGGLEAFELFFSEIPHEVGMSFVVITHLDRDHISALSEILKRYTTLPVYTIEDGLKVESNSIYVIPQRKNVTISDGILHLTEQVDPHYSNMPVNYFLQSLALYLQEEAAAIILSGAGADGMLGARDIKLYGGLVIAQEPSSAKFDSMPKSVMTAGYADFVLQPEHMSTQLIKWASHGEITDGKKSSDLQQLFAIVRAKTGYDFSSYKINTILRRIEKQMYAHQIQSLPDYVKLLRTDSEEAIHLYKSFLIGVTRFFRDTEAFEVFKNEILPKLFKDKPADYCIRVWVPGCSSGEEVYSIAIAMAEYMHETKTHFNVQIFGTDIDTNALATARSGLYPFTILNDISPARLKQYFSKEKNGYKIKNEIRSLVVFGEQNIIKDPPFTKVDLISCRNLLIYLGMNLQKKILPLFHYSLKPKGMLFLGMSESISGYTDLFELSYRNVKFFERKDTPASRRTVMSFSPDTELDNIEFRTPGEKLIIDEHSEANLLLKRYLFDKFVSPCILINKKGEISYIHGDVHNYIKSVPFVENSNISMLVHYNIKNLLNSAIQTVIIKKKEVSYYNLSIKHDKTASVINLRILPLLEIKSLSNMILIVFESASEAQSYQKLPEVKDHAIHKNNKIVVALENELHYTKENLQATIEEMESSNEELQSMNEELQSTNEEMETSKEELHSLNEELVIMNTELQERIDQLASVHDDMTNLFNSTDIATFFLDSNLCIKRYTPKAQEFIPLIPTDIGRSIAHFATSIKYEKLVEDAQEVLRTLNQKIFDVQSKLGRWFTIRIIPYRTLLNKIDGVVITLTDITEHKEIESKVIHLNDALVNALTCSKNILDTVMMPLLVLSLDLKVLSANRSFYKNFPLLPEETIGKFLYNLEGWKLQSLREMLEREFPEDNMFEGFEIDQVYTKNGHKKIICNARKIFNNEFGSDVLLLAMELK